MANDNSYGLDPIEGVWNCGHLRPVDQRFELCPVCGRFSDTWNAERYE